MKGIIFGLVLISCYVAISYAAFSQATVSVYYYGDGICAVCGSKNYTLSDDDSWYNGTRSFMDPTPKNSVVTQITVSTTSATYCTSPSADYEIAINGESIGKFTGDYECSCGQCPQANTVISDTYSNGFPGYQYGQQNSISVLLALAGNIIGVGELTLTITYSQGSSSSSSSSSSTGKSVTTGKNFPLTTGGNFPVTTGNSPVTTAPSFVTTGSNTPPTNLYNVSVIVPYMGCGYCELCGATNYSLSNQGADCGEGIWDQGYRTFNDPIPSSGVLVQVILITNEFFWCEAPVSSSFSLNDIDLGDIDVQNSECGCDACPAPRLITSEYYSAGFPAYKYGHENAIQVFVDNGVVGVKILELILTYQY